MRYPRWFRNVFLVVSTLLLTVFAVNLAIDPYGVYRLVDIEGFNATKHMATDHAREVNYYLARKHQARTITMGNSRISIAMDPQHPGWPGDSRPVFNLGMPGLLIEDVLGYLKLVLNDQELDRVVLGIDFLMFSRYDYGLPDPEPVPESFDLRGFHLRNLLSLHTFKDSIDTLRKQDRFRYPDYREDGMMAESFKSNRVARDGYLETFHWAEENYFAFRPQFSAIDPKTRRSSYDTLRDIIRLAAEHQIELILFISPMHARYLELFHFSDLWQDYEEWKRMLVRIVEDPARDHSGTPEITLWDFSGYNSITTEAVPPPGDTHTEMTYYWETSHYKKQAGDLILDRIFSGRSNERGLPEDFGIRLTSENLEDHLSAIREARYAYRRSHSEEINDLETMRARYWDQ